jgi:hypothetical protein
LSECGRKVNKIDLQNGKNVSEAAFLLFLARKMAVGRLLTAERRHLLGSFFSGLGQRFFMLSWAIF